MSKKAAQIFAGISSVSMSILPFVKWIVEVI